MPASPTVLKLTEERPEDQTVTHFFRTLRDDEIMQNANDRSEMTDQAALGSLIRCGVLKRGYGVSLKTRNYKENDKLCECADTVPRCAFRSRSERILVAAAALLEHGKRVVVGARVKSAHAVALVSLLESLFDSLDVNTCFKVVLAVVVTQTVLDIVVVRCLSADDSGLVVSAGAEDIGPLGAGRNATTSIVAQRALHGVLLSTAANGDTGVESGEQRVDVELGERQVEDQVEGGGGGQEKNEIDNGKDGGERTSLEGHSNQLGDNVVGRGETGSRLVKGEDERAGDENVSERSETEPQDDDDLELLELLEEEDDLDTNGGTNGAEERNEGTNTDQGGHDLRVHELVHTPGEEELGGKGDDTSHDGIGGKGSVTLGGVVEVAIVGNEVLVHEDLIKDSVDGIGDNKEEDKVPHEGLVGFEVDIVDVSLDDGETIEPNVEHDTDVHAAEGKVHGGELGHKVRHLE